MSWYEASAAAPGTPFPLRTTTLVSFGSGTAVFGLRPSATAVAFSDASTSGVTKSETALRMHESSTVIAATSSSP